jgi:formate dehydrogenase major subunit
MVAGMSYKRLDEMGGIQWPCYDENHPGELFLHSRLWKQPREGMAAPFSAVKHELPLEAPNKEYPFTLTTGRRLDSYNTGVQTGGYTSPLRRGETLDISPADAARLKVKNGDKVRVTSRRGSVVAPVHIDRGLRKGLVFMTLHFQDEVATNLLTVDYTDPKSGTAEFKACAVSVVKVKGKTLTPGVSRGKSKRVRVRAKTAAATRSPAKTLTPGVSRGPRARGAK